MDFGADTEFESSPLESSATSDQSSEDHFSKEHEEELEAQLAPMREAMQQVRSSGG